MFGRARRAQLDAARGSVEIERIARTLRRQRRGEMRYYRRKRIWQALQRARLELAMRKALPPLLLYTLVAAASGVVIGFAIHWLRS